MTSTRTAESPPRAPVELLTTQELARALGVSESSVKRWADDGALAATRTVGGHRRIPLREAIRFVRDRRLALAHAEVLGLSDVEKVRAQAPPADTIAALQQFLLAGDDVRSRGLLLSLFVSGVSVATILDGPIRASMAGIGELWHRDPAGVFLEHRATEICVQALQQLRALLPVPPRAPVAVGGGLEGDPYVLGSLSAATLLAAEGYHAVNLGAETPLATLEEAARRLGARIVWVSVSSPPARERVPGLLARLARAVEPLGASVVAGGRDPSVFELPRLPNLHAGRSMGELAAFARGLSAGSTARKGRGA